MAERDFVEYRFENFSFWDKKFHGNCLKWDHFIFFVIELFPRGLDGNGKHLVVKVCDSKESSRVELSYIGADGSLICKQEVQDPEWNGYSLTLPPGPKFKEYVRTTANKDVLTLRLYRSDNKYGSNGCITIDVAERCFKIPAALFKGMKKGEYLDIYQLRIHGDKIFHISAGLVGSKQKDNEISIKLTPICDAKNYLFHIFVSLLDHHDAVKKSKDGKHEFSVWDAWTLPTSFKLKEVIENDFYVTLCVKAISKDLRYITYDSPIEQIDSSSIKAIVQTVKDGNSTSQVTSDNPSVSVLTEDFMCLLQDQDFSDFQLTCGNVSFPVHRNILSARSPVFKTMLSCDMQEAATGRMDIVDMDPSTLALFLTFLYTGQVESDLQCDIALKLYFAADKYQVPTLKKECSDFLCAKVSISNVCDILSLADKHQDDRLTSEAQDFILKNYKEVLCSEEWKSFMTKEPLLAVQIVTQFTERNKVHFTNTRFLVYANFLSLNSLI